VLQTASVSGDWSVSRGPLVKFSGTKVVPLRGHDNFVLSAAFSPDGTRIVSGSADKTSRIWDVVSGPGVVTGDPFEGTMIDWVAFSMYSDCLCSIWDAMSGILKWDHQCVGTTTWLLQLHSLQMVLASSPDHSTT
jgi:WD40 repeat protein